MFTNEFRPAFTLSDKSDSPDLEELRNTNPLHEATRKMLDGLNRHAEELHRAALARQLGTDDEAILRNAAAYCELRIYPAHTLLFFRDVAILRIDKPVWHPVGDDGLLRYTQTHEFL